MNPLQALGFALGVSFASGLNLYATVATLGLLQRFEIVRLPGSLEVLSHPMVLGIAIFLYVVEFFADKIPYVDSLWDVLHSFIRPPAAAILAYAAVAEVGEPWRLAAALLAGTVALTSHGTKVSTRAAVNASPEPASNWLLSLGEDGTAMLLAWFAAVYPIPALFVAGGLVILSIVMMTLLFKFLRGVGRRMSQTPKPG